MSADSEPRSDGLASGPTSLRVRVNCAACLRTVDRADCLTHFVDTRTPPTAWPEMTHRGRRYHYCPRPACRAAVLELGDLLDPAGVATDGEMIELELGGRARLRMVWENRSRHPMIATPETVGYRNGADGFCEAYSLPRGGIAAFDRPTAEAR